MPSSSACNDVACHLLLTVLAAAVGVLYGRVRRVRIGQIRSTAELRIEGVL